MNGATLFPCNLKIAKLPMLSMQPILKPRKHIIMPNTKTWFASGIKVTAIGSKQMQIIKRLFGWIL